MFKKEPVQLWERHGVSSSLKIIPNDYHNAQMCYHMVEQQESKETDNTENSPPMEAEISLKNEK